MKKRHPAGLQDRRDAGIALLMKVVIVFVTAWTLLFTSAALGQGGRMNFEADNIPIAHALRRIEKLSAFRFVYANDIFPATKKVTIHVRNVTISNLLDRILQGTGFTYRFSDDLIVLTPAAGSAALQLIEGRVINTAGVPLEGVTVTAEPGNQQTTTSGDGKFIISAGMNAALRISSIGFLAQTIVAGTTNNIIVVLQQQVEDLNEVVKVGYGARSRKDLTAAVSAINANPVARSTALTPQMAMQGQLAGVSVIGGGSNPTARPTVRVRGVGTFTGNGAADPLYIIDGIPLVEGGAGATVDKVNDPTRRGPINLYTLINANDVESITVLKDAAAAVYGVRAANGVVLITTKSGKKGPLKAELHLQYGLQHSPATYDVLNTQEYVKFYTQAYLAFPDLSGTNPVPIHEALNFGSRWEPGSENFIGNNPTYDWQSSVIKRHSNLSNYLLRASGGTDQSLYSFSIGYNDNDGPFVGYATNRYSLSGNIVSKVGSKLEFGLNVKGVQQTTDNPPGEEIDVSLDVWRAPPWQKIYDGSGPRGFAPLWRLDEPLTPTNFKKSSLYSQQYVAYRNVHGLLALTDNSTKSQTALGTGYFQVQPLAGLRLRGAVSAQQTTLELKEWEGFDRWWFIENPVNPFSIVADPQPGTKPGLVGISNSATISLLKSFNVDFVRDIGDHRLHITADASQQQYKWTGNGAESWVESEDPARRYFHITGNENGFYEMRASYALIGYLARINYSYHKKYYGEVVIRRDGSSRFAPGRQWGTFPSATVGWRLSDENFLQGVEFVNDLKLRLSYGLLGNEQTTGGWSYRSVANAVRPTYTLGTPQIIQPGISFSSLPNTELTWEKLRTANVGIDAILFNNSLSLSVDYFHKVTNGIIQSVELNPSAGISTATDINIAKVLNRGVELQAAYQVSFGAVRARLSANFTSVHNEVLKLANNTALRGAGLEVGYPIGFIHGYQMQGIFQSEKDVDQWRSIYRDIISKEQKPGDIYFADLYGKPTPGTTSRNYSKDFVVDDNDQTYLGKTIPGYYYGFNTLVSFKQFDLSIFFHGVGDVQKYNLPRARGENMDGFGRNQFRSVLNAWTVDKPSSTMPRAVYSDPNGNNRISSRFVEDAGFLRLQNAQIRYAVPRQVFKGGEVLHNLKLSLTAVNLFTITRYSGLDPENDDFPNTRQLLFGLTATF